MKTPIFTGPFAPMCEAFVAQKRALGFSYEQQAMLLKRFDDFCKAYEVHNYTITIQSQCSREHSELLLLSFRFSFF